MCARFLTVKNPLPNHLIHLSHETNPPTFRYTGWFNRDHYNGLL